MANLIKTIKTKIQSFGGLLGQMIMPISVFLLPEVYLHLFLFPQVEHQIKNLQPW